MEPYSTFDSTVYSEETYPVTESEYNEVMQVMAEESSAAAGYNDWMDSLEPTERAAQIEQDAFEQAQARRKQGNWNRRDNGDIRINGIAI